MPLLLTGGLEGEEADALRDHLASGCPRCAGSLAEARATLDHLPMALDPVAPPAAVRGRLLDRVRASDARGGAPAVHKGKAKPGGQGRPGRGGVLRRLWSSRPVAAALAAALAVLVTYAAVSIGAAPARQESDELRQRLAALDQERTRAEQRALAVRQMLDATADIFGALRSSTMHVASLMGVETQDERDEGWGGRLLWDRERNIGHVFTPRLAPAEDGKAYNLWFITEDQQMIRAGVFNVDESGRGSFKLTVPADLGPLMVKSGSISYDPAEGAEEPGHPILVGDFGRPAPLAHDRGETALRDRREDR